MENEEFIESCLKKYDDLMEDTVDSAKSKIELESRHNEVKSEILESLPTLWRKSKGDVNTPVDIQKLVSQRMESTFQKVIKGFEKSQLREKNTLAAMTLEKDAITYYTDEMDRYIKNNPNASPKEINLVHAKYATLATQRAKSKSGADMSSHTMEAIKRETEDRRKVYYERAEMVLKANKDPAIGIDLGTTMCCVMVFYKGKCVLVPNRPQGNSNTTPSYVAFHKNGSDTFGYVAKEEAHRHPETTIYDAKRMIGREFSDPKLQGDLKKWPFEVVNDEDNVKIKTWESLRYPHEISARLLTRLRLMAEDHLRLAHGSIKRAVITVPAYFSEPQRRATNDAAVCAGLQVLNILSEPTAAAIAYSWEQWDTGRTKRSLIYDLGGGTFDIAIANVQSNDIEILVVDGDTHLGGQDFDQLLMNHCIQEFSSNEGIDLAALRDSKDASRRNEARSALCRLKIQCEKAKERLTGTSSTVVQIEKIYGTKDLIVTITKTTMERLVRPLVQTTIDIMKRALEEAKLKGISGKEDIDDVIMVGGSTRMPLVMEMVSEYFGGKQLCKHINPDEAVAFGAAIQAAILNKNEDVKAIKVQDVTPMSLGCKIIPDKLCILIPKNSKVPCSASEIFVTVNDFQKSIRSDIFQGENPMASRNKWLGTFTIHDIPEKLAGEEKFVQTMTIDAMGMLHVKEVSLSTGQSAGITVSAERIGMDKNTMSRVAEECKQIRI